MGRLSLLAVRLAAIAFFVYPTDAGNVNQTAVAPMQIRLAYAGPTGVVVSWNTFSKLPQPKVHYGSDPHQLTDKASSDVSVTYPTSLTYNNHVKITGLQPNTQYYYLPEHSGSSAPYTFKTGRVAGDDTPYSIAFVADLGLIGPDGLTTHVGTGAANPLGPNDITTIQSIEQNLDHVEFLWHGTCCLPFFVVQLC